MNDSLRRISAIIKTDFLLRFRRPSTIVIFLLVCLAMYLFVPDPASGSSLMTIQGHRVYYDSATVAMGTAMLCALLLSLIGYYLVSDSIVRDVESRTGFVIASTSVRNGEYLFAKLFGNCVFLTAISAGLLAVSIVMHLVHGEGPLEPSVFLLYYLNYLLPVIIFVSVMALVFESVPFLSGKFGSFAYFFLWTALLGAVTASVIQSGSASSPSPRGWGSYVDTVGLSYGISEMRSSSKTENFTIGHTPFDPKKEPLRYRRLPFRRDWLLARASSALYPLPLMAIALLCFHRFDPVRVKAAGHSARRSLLRAVNARLKPLARLFLLNGIRGDSEARVTFLASVLSDTMLTVLLYPLILVAIVGFAIAGATVPGAGIGRGLLPVVFFGVGVVLADIPTRERRAGTTAIVYAVPLVKQSFVWWKFASGLLLALSFAAVPGARLTFTNPGAALSLLIGCAFVTAASTCLGILSSNPKTFIVAFLMFWYVALNDAGRFPGFDFAGWYGIATPNVRIAYAASAIALLALTQFVYSIRHRAS